MKLNLSHPNIQKVIQRCREKGVILPKFSWLRNPESIPPKIVEKLKEIGLWDVHPLNLFRITWKNEPVEKGGGFGKVNYMEIPKELSGVEARIFVLLGKFFPTGAHKVGATYGVLVDKLLSGQFDPTRQKALWPSTGNYCRGGAFNSALLGCPSIAVLPEEMSRERFEWLEKIGSEVVKTPGCESNVKEIYDKTKELKEQRGDEILVLNQFEEFGNPLWHYAITGPAMEEVFGQESKNQEKFRGLFLTQGSAGTLGAGDYLRKQFPLIKIAAGEALQCPTLLRNGYGGHRIEGIGDKHVPWVHNIKNMDMVIAIDDEVPMRLLRLFNEEEGQKYLIQEGVPQDIVEKLPLLGISSIANIAGAIKMAKYYEWTEKDVVFTLSTDSAAMYGSRIEEDREKRGDYTKTKAAIDFERYLRALNKDDILELTYYEKRRIHNLKYFTWVEQQGKSVEELDEQWYSEEYWDKKLNRADELDEQIEEFNRAVGILDKMLS